MRAIGSNLRLNRPLRELGFLVLTVLCVSFYFWTADARAPFASPVPDSYFDKLTNAFLHGQASLLEKPDPKLLALPDPYDPGANAAYRLHDALLYKGKYYLYWGVAPVIVLYAPVRLLTGQFVHDDVACALFASGGLLLSLLLIRQIRADYLRQSSRWTLACSMLLLAFGNLAPFVLRRAVVYEVAITCGYLLTMAFLFATYNATFRDRPNLKWIWAAGCLLGLVFLTRPNQASSSLALFVGLYRWRHLSGARMRIIASSSMLMICMGAQGLYNFARFGSPLEYGIKYQLAGISLRDYPIASATRALFSGWMYLCNLPRVTPVFPFITVQTYNMSGPFDSLSRALWKLAPKTYPEPSIGIVLVVPLLFALLAAPSFLRRSSSVALRAFFLSVLLWAGLTGFFSAAVGSTLRYEMDFLPGLLLATVILLLWIDTSADVRWRQLFVRSIIGVGALYSVTVSAALGLTGYEDRYHRRYPLEYRAVAQPLNAIVRFVFHAEYPGIEHVRLGRPVCPPADVGWPLLATGVSGAGDFLSLRCVASGTRFAIAWDHWGIPAVFGPPFRLPDKAPIDVEIEAPTLFEDYEHLSCNVWIDHRRVFHQDPCDMYPADPSQIFVLRNPIGGGTTVASYVDVRANDDKYPGIVSARLARPTCAAPNAPRPLLSTGVFGAGDFIGLRCDSSSHTFTVAWDHWGIPAKIGEPFALAPRAPLYVRIAAPALFAPDGLDAHGQHHDYSACTVQIDGRIVFHEEACHMYPALPSQIFVLKNPIGGGTTAASY